MKVGAKWFKAFCAKSGNADAGFCGESSAICGWLRMIISRGSVDVPKCVGVRRSAAVYKRSLWGLRVVSVVRVR